MILYNERKIIKIFIVDDHPIVRRGLRQYIENQEGFTICGEAEDANKAILLLNSCQPDIVILDLDLKGISGIELIKAIKKRYKNTNIMVFTIHDENRILKKAIESGAKGYILKNDDEQNIIDAIKQVMIGKTFLSNSLKDKMLDDLLWHSSKNNDNLINDLADRELEIFTMIGRGMNSLQIANKLNLSVSTIGTYRERIKSKLHIISSNQLVKHAVQWVVKSEI